MDGYMTIPDIAAALCIDASRVRHDILAGRLGATKLGRDLIVATAEYERYRAARRPRGRPRGQKETT